MTKRNDPISDRVAGNIARLRRGHGYSGEMLAERCVEFGRGLEPPIESNINFGMISKMENGDRTVSVTELVLFAGALAVTSDELMGLVTSNTPETSAPPLEIRVAALEETVARLLDQ